MAHADTYNTLSDQEQYILELVNTARTNPAKFQAITDIATPEWHTFAPPLINAPQLMQTAETLNTGILNGEFDTGHLYEHLYDDIPDNATLLYQQMANNGCFASAALENMAMITFNEQIPPTQETILVMFSQILGDNGSYGASAMLDNEMNLAGISIQTGELTPDSGLPGMNGCSMVIDYADHCQPDNRLLYLTGVIYNDSNGNGMYDPGEGIEGAKVQAEGTGLFAMTSASGGYALEMPMGVYNITTDLPNTERMRVALLTGNMKLDIAHHDDIAGSFVTGSVTEQADIEYIEHKIYINLNSFLPVHLLAGIMGEDNKILWLQSDGTTLSEQIDFLDPVSHMTTVSETAPYDNGYLVLVVSRVPWQELDWESADYMLDIISIP